MIKLFKFIVIISLTHLNAQSSSEIKTSIISQNNIQTEVWNYGSISSPGALSHVRDFVWKGLGYMYEFGTLVSAEVVDNNGDTLHITSDSFVSPSEGDYDPSGLVKWGWLPVEGFANSSNYEIASSNIPETWEESWKVWPGEYGEGISVSNNELYYKMNDFTNFEFIDRYQPFIDDYSKGGLGVSAEVRIYQFGGGMKDALIVKYFVKNESDKDLDKVYFGFQCDPHIGGGTDYSDDLFKIIMDAPNSIKIKSNYSNETISHFDEDYLGAGNKATGILSMKILESPNNIGLSSYVINPWGSVRPKEDEIIWHYFERKINYLSGFDGIPGDYVTHFGTGPFSLEVGQTKIVKLALFLSDNFDDVLEDATYISLHHNWALMGNEISESGGDNNFKIELNDLSEIVNGETEISWNYSGNAEDAKIFLEYSHNKGIDWAPLAVELNSNSSFNWNSNDVDDGVNYILRIVAYNQSNPENYFYDISSTRFTIDNPNVNSKPELELLTMFKDTTITKSPIKIEWVAEDADNSELEVKIHYSFSFDGNYSEINTASYLTGKNSFLWDFTDFPNAEEYFLKITVSDGDKDSSIISFPFKVDVFENILTHSHIKSFRGNATPIIQIQTIDVNKLTNDEYSIKFNVEETNKTFELKNITKNEMLLNDYSVNNLISTPLIDGMKIIIDDKENDIDYSKSEFVGPNANSLDFQVEFPPILGSRKIKVDEDFLFIFNDFDTLSTGEWKNADTLETLLGPIILPFSIWNFNGKAPNFDYLQPAVFVLYEPNHQTQNNGRWDFGEKIILQPKGTTGSTVTYQVSFNFQNQIFPLNGDSLYLITFNEIEDGDEFRFSPDSNFVVKVKNEIIHHNFSLSQNYPNPFNPTTVISYSISSESNIDLSQQNVQLKIYDVLGREIKTLVNKIHTPGKYSVEFNASTLSSGIYFYRLQSGDYLETKKMILLR